MAAAKAPKELNEFGKRVKLAWTEEGYRSQNEVERRAGLGKGYLSRLMHGDRGGTSFSPMHMQSLAKLLHVNFEWLVIGSGPMRRDGRGTTPAEQAITNARVMGCREDAITIAWDRNRDREKEMTASDWTDAILAEAKRLDRAGIPRPEVAADKQGAIRRTKERLQKKVKSGEKNAEAPSIAPKRRAIGGGV